MNDDNIKKFDLIKMNKLYAVISFPVGLVVSFILFSLLDFEYVPSILRKIILRFSLLSTLGLFCYFLLKIKCPCCGYRFNVRSSLSSIKHCPSCGKRLDY